jgi:hypothetical protein
VIALLSQCQRERARDGAVIATLDDYEQARLLLEPIFAAISTEGVTKAVRQTVEAIPEAEEISIAELARRLGLSKTATYARVQRALTGGWLVNREEREGRHYPAKLARGAPLPEDRPILPTKDDLVSSVNNTAPKENDPCSSPSEAEQEIDHQVNNGVTEEIGTCPPEEQRDCSRRAGVEQPVEQQVNSAVPMENGSCSPVLVDSGDIPPPSSLLRVMESPRRLMPSLNEKLSSLKTTCQHPRRCGISFPMK